MKCMSSKRVRASGFTLIEVLVVVAILALLIAILMPSLRNAKELSKATVCGTRMAETFKGVLMYSHQNGDRIPYFAWIDDGNQPAGSEWWPTQLARVMGNQFEAYVCPTDDRPKVFNVVYSRGTIRMPRGGERTVPLKVTWRSACDTTEYITTTGGRKRARKLTSWKHPATSVLLIEARAQTGNEDRECFRFKNHMREAANPSVIRANPWLRTWQRHLGKSNLTFIDGHIGRLTPKQVARLADHQEFYLD